VAHHVNLRVMSFYNPTQVVIDGFLKEVRSQYSKMFGDLKINYAQVAEWAGGMALEIIANTDALYHNLEHTIFVTQVGMEILRGKHISVGGVTPDDWLHFVIALLCHDIGYVKGVCQGDNIEKNIFLTGVAEPSTVSLPRGASDAGLTRYHVDRGKLFVRQRFGGHSIINVDIIGQNIELTRFPVPKDDDHKDITGYPGLLRAADLMGQMSDPRYQIKIPALFAEFKETGEADHLGYKTPQDLRDGYPSFFWKLVLPYVKPAIKHLQVTQLGKQYMNNLLAGVSYVQFAALL